jgi:hypothetical protein
MLEAELLMVRGVRAPNITLISLAFPHNVSPLIAKVSQSPIVYGSLLSESQVIRDEVRIRRDETKRRLSSMKFMGKNNKFNEPRAAR